MWTGKLKNMIYYRIEFIYLETCKMFIDFKFVKSDFVLREKLLASYIWALTTNDLKSLLIEVYRISGLSTKRYKKLDIPFFVLVFVIGMSVYVANDAI